MGSIFKRLVKNKHINEFIKYLTVSFLAVIVDYSVYRFLFATQIFSRAISGTISYLTGLFLAYYLLKKYVFLNKSVRRNSHKQIFLFFISGIIGALTTFISIIGYEAMVSSDTHLAKLVAMGFSFFIVYIFRKIVVFKKK